MGHVLTWHGIGMLLKASTRAKCGKGVRRCVVADAIIPGDWKGFLLVESNKVELFKFLSKVLLGSFSQDDKQFVITDGESAKSKPFLQYFALLSPCSHKEADSCMLLHASHAAQNGHQKILTRTVDRDVVGLSVYVAQSLSSECEFWIALGTGKHYRYLAAHSMAVALGPEKAKALPMFHALLAVILFPALSGTVRRQHRPLGMFFLN